MNTDTILGMEVGVEVTGAVVRQAMRHCHNESSMPASPQDSTVVDILTCTSLKIGRDVGDLFLFLFILVDHHCLCFHQLIYFLVGVAMAITFDVLIWVVLKSKADT